MGRRRVRDMAEEDAFTGWRRVLCYVQRPGVRSAVKRRARRRERHETRHAIRRDEP